ncbi:related to conserved hypothetical protein [Ustilago hordei]|uniref:Uncharacterized protein n=1 Tax=Ustilago hordei TaxID=120017 RepID=I2FN76_USTHO|nr:related to conserved hypothetical protein [Ustilago hordei]KAJ1591425.1 hypothetical protein NDA15_005355 [Ustilago hordei]KAJ1593648.1 hypothetical protein NDA12_003378 [Ustilago hordei]CCF48369.1 uncharacterized protein UHOR_08893 [Ustilago hordei]SYW81202.1 related to conserved hypothetcial protein [Ustilago hordei]
MASSTTRSRPGGQHRSLPTLTLFNHPAARLIKTIPPLKPPTRLNGHVPTDSLGAGRISNTDVVLTDVYGPLSVLMVPDPLDPTIATLVLSVGIQDAKLQGAARRFVLPFRSFQRDPVSGQLISQSQIKGFDAADRTLYPGLGAGLKGLDGGSFWFFENVGEEGAFDRYRWEKDRVGRRAIWTVWLISTPAPIVLHVQNLLQSYPAPVPPLPPWLEEDSGYPWRDTFVALPSASALTPTILKGQLPTDAFVAIQSTSPAAFSVARRLHAIPQVPVEPEHLRGESCISTKATSADIDALDAFQDTLTSSQDQSADPALKTYVDDGATPTTSQLTVRSRHLRHASSSVTIGDGPEVIMHNAPRTTAISEYRNSLIAVDNLTGQIIGVLASDINLHSSSTGISQPVDVAAMTSSDQVEANAEDKEEIQTPLDEHTRILHSKGAEDLLGMQTAPASTPEEPELPETSSSDRDITTPRPNTFIHRPAPVYRDAAVASSTVAAPTPPVVMPNIQTEPRSILDVNTFAPPPLPLKQLALRAASRPTDITADTPPSRCTSTASAAFFSAESDTEAVSSYDSDALEIDARSITHDNLPTSFISMRGKTAKNIERHRPELLQDQGKARRIDDDDVESDASGSTVGGPAVRMWRKARAKGKKKPSAKSAAAAQVTQPRQGIKSRQASEMSDRTSKAETAFEALSDNEDSTGAGDDAPPIASSATAEGEADNVAPLLIRPTGPGHHLPRSALRTDEVRSIEDRVWREALDAGQLPIDAPYTHLAARGDAGFYPSSILSSPPSSVDGSAIELLSAQDKAREAQKKKKRLRQQNQRAERIMNMQGGTVLIEFLAGSSRIGASLIRSAGLDTGAAADQDRVIELQASAKTSEVASNVLGYVPLLPQHLLSFFGLSSTSPQSATNAAAAASKAADAPPSSSYLSGLRLPAFGGLLSDASDWVTNLFSFNSAPATSPTNADSLGDPSRAEEWEYAIPEFDPNSLSSTPRPVYRRKRPVPSAVNGFNISAPLSAASKDVIAESAKVEQAAAQPSTSSNEQRYSILHIDSLGIGRRAFLRGVAGA